MKSITFLITVLLVMGLSAHAQQRTRDILFPNYAKDQARFKGSVQPLANKPSEALIASPKALREMIFKTYGGGSAVPASTPVVTRETRQLGSSKSAADVVKEVKEQQAAQTKIVAPKPEQQGTETEQKPKN
jgi:hypothetical protein